MTTNVIVCTVNGANAIHVSKANDVEVFVVNGSALYNDKRIYDLRWASTQQIKTINKKSAIDLGDESASFLRALIEHVTGPARTRLEQFV